MTTAVPSAYMHAAGWGPLLRLIAGLHFSATRNAAIQSLTAAECVFEGMCCHRPALLLVARFTTGPAGGANTC
jgi:hypothetical protein